MSVRLLGRLVKSFVPGAGEPQGLVDASEVDLTGGSNVQAFIDALGDNFKGLWSNTATYVANDLVIYNKIFYIALRNNSSAQPNNSLQDWEVIGDLKGQWNSQATYNINDIVFRHNKLWIAIRNNSRGTDPIVAGQADWRAIERTDQEIRDLAREELGRYQPAQSDPYAEDSRNFFGNTFSHSHTESFSITPAEGVTNFGSWRGDATPYSPTNTDGIIITEGSNAVFNNTDCAWSGLTNPVHSSSATADKFIKGRIRIASVNTGVSEIIVGFHHNNLDYPQLRLHNGVLQSNHNGTRETQDWQNINGVNAAGAFVSSISFESGTRAEIVFEYQRGSTGAVEFILATRQIGGSSPRTIRVNNFYETNHSLPVTEIRSRCESMEWFEVWNGPYSTHSQEAELEEHVDEIGLGKVAIVQHATDVNTYRGDSNFPNALKKGGIDVATVNDIQTPQRGARGYSIIPLHTLVAHDADGNTVAPSAPTIAAGVTPQFNFQTSAWSGVPSDWGYNISPSHRAGADDVYVVLGVVDENGSLVGSFTSTPVRSYGEVATVSGLSESEVLALIPTWARANNPTGEIPVGLIPATIARITDITSRLAGYVTTTALDTAIAPFRTAAQVTSAIDARISNEEIPRDGASTTNAPSQAAVNSALQRGVFSSMAAPGLPLNDNQGPTDIPFPSGVTSLSQIASFIGLTGVTSDGPFTTTPTLMQVKDAGDDGIQIRDAGSLGYYLTYNTTTERLQIDYRYDGGFSTNQGNAKQLVSFDWPVLQDTGSQLVARILRGEMDLTSLINERIKYYVTNNTGQIIPVGNIVKNGEKVYIAKSEQSNVTVSTNFTNSANWFQLDNTIPAPTSGTIPTNQFPSLTMPFYNTNGTLNSARTVLSIADTITKASWSEGEGNPDGLDNVPLTFWWYDTDTDILYRRFETADDNGNFYYPVSVKLDGPGIVSLLAALTGDDRLDGNAVKNLPGTVEDLTTTVEVHNNTAHISLPQNRTLANYSSFLLRFTYTDAGGQAALGQRIVTCVPIAAIIGTYTSLTSGGVTPRDAHNQTYAIPLEHRGANSVFLMPCTPDSSGPRREILATDTRICFSIADINEANNTFRPIQAIVAKGVLS